MKTIPTIIFLILTSFCLGQTAPADKVVMELTVDYKPATLEVFKSKNYLSSLQTYGGKLVLKGFETDYYSFRISARGQKTTKSDSILVKKGQTLELNVSVNGPCLYDHPADKTPTCPENHTDNIVPIVYGLLAQTPDAKNDFYPGGCMVSDCDPKYYCKKHQIEF